MKRTNRPARARCLAAGLLVAAALLAGCAAPATPRSAYEPALAPTADRMVAAYADLATRRFHVLADFETPEQGSLFRFETGGAPIPMAITTERARRETGVGALQLPLAHASHQVVAADSPDSRWGLLRDWSRYHLLLFSVFSPRDLGGFTFAIGSGTDRRLLYRHPRVFLKPGWNLVRADLGDIADEIHIADVRQMRFWCDPLDTPVNLYLDDLVLVDNEEAVFGRPDGEPGDLYVLSRGRRTLVGAVARFELVFARARIARWFDLAADPNRLHNLAARGGLGPTPVVVAPGAAPPLRLDDPAQWAGLGQAVESSQRVDEAGPLRAVVTGEWRFGPPGAPPGEHSPFHRWEYCVYADGRVCLLARGTARTPSFEPPGLGIAFLCDADAGFTPCLVDDAPPGENASPRREPFALFSRPEAGRADLLIVPAAPLTPRPIHTPPRLGVLWMIPTEGDQFLLTALLRLGPADLDAPDQARPRAADYRRPLPLTLDAGQLVRTDDGDLDNDGFSEGRGYYVLQLDGNVARIRLDGRTLPRFSPVFRVVDVAGRDVWVYADGRQVRNTCRLPQGDVLFAVPGPVTGEQLIEVNAGPRAAPALEVITSP